MTRSIACLALAALAFTLAAACSSRTVVVRDEPRPYEPAPPPPPPREVVIVEPRDPVDILRADDINAGRVAARVIYADTIRADAGHIGQIIEVGPGRGPGHGHGHGRARGDISANDVVFDEIYADNINTSWVEADIVYVRKLKMGHDQPPVAHRPERRRETVVVVEQPRVEERRRDVVVVENPRHRGTRDTVVVVDDRGRGRGKDKVVVVDNPRERREDQRKVKNDDDSDSDKKHGKGRENNGNSGKRGRDDNDDDSDSNNGKGKPRKR